MLPDGHMELARRSKPPPIFWWDDPLVSGISEVSHRDCDYIGVDKSQG